MGRLSMRPPEDLEVTAWIEKAQSDLRMAEFALSEAGGLWDQACFHSQQAAEKCLKALLVAMETDVPRTHDLVSLMERCAPAFPAPQDLLEKAAILSQYGVASRYPSFLAPETRQDARRAFSYAIAIGIWSCRAAGVGEFSRQKLVLTATRQKGRSKRTARPRKKK
jgi:HEPN domain-containing protein